MSMGLVIALVAGLIGAEATPSAAHSSAAVGTHQQELANSNVNDEHFGYFYDPAEFLQICAQFPGLAACQQGSGALVEKRKSAYMRFGRSAPEAVVEMDEEPAMEKRKSAYMRFGKRSPPVQEEEFAGEEMGQEVAKRKSAYMRFGKRKSAYMRFGKRSAAAEENMGAMEKRKSAYMRFGKRR